MALTNSKTRAYLVALGALAILAVAMLGAGAAGAASSGGVSTLSSGGGTSTDEAAASRVNERYSKIWDGEITPAEKRWAHRTAECESGGDPNAIGGGGIYRGAFQFMRSTWTSSPKSPGGDP